MAKIIGGIGASHTPTIGFAKDANKATDPQWAPIFEDFAVVRSWLIEQKIDTLLVIYNDHVSSFFFDHYSAFTLGVDDHYLPADEGGGPRHCQPAKGNAALSHFIGRSLVADGFDLAFFRNRPLDHGCFSPLSMLTDIEPGWQGSIVPLQVGVLQSPSPGARRCYNLGHALRKAIHAFPDDTLRIAILGTGGLSHQIHGERCGFNNTRWDQEFLTLLEHDPETLARMRLVDFAERGGFESAEIVMWLMMRGALSQTLTKRHESAYLPSMTNIVTVIYEDLGLEPTAEANAAWRKLMDEEWLGVENLAGTYPFTLERCHRAFGINDFLHRLTIPEHRRRFIEDQEALFAAHGLTNEEQRFIRELDWIGMIRYGVIFFVLEKLAVVVGRSNVEVYAAMRGEDLETFQRSRNVAMTYSVGAITAAKGSSTPG